MTRKLIFICRLLISAVLVLSAAIQAESVFDQTPEKTYAKSVVMIRSVSQDMDYTTPWKMNPMRQGVGSGFVIDGSRVLTNAHNVSNCRYVELKKQNLPKRYPAMVSYIGHDCDLAILVVSDPSFFSDMVPLELGGIPKSNSRVQTCGFPIGGMQVSVTEGVVSRVQTSIYSHPQADSHLVVQTDAAINPGNSGGPVLQDGKVVGVAFQGIQSADNIGYMIPTTVISHFLRDIEDGKYDGFGSLGFTLYPGLHSKSYAEYLKVPQETEGIVVLRTLMNSSVESVLKPGDVITKIDEFDIDNDGMINIYGLTLELSEAIERKQIGDKVELAFYRDGKLNTATIDVAVNKPPLSYSKAYDKQPRYRVFAGLVFVPLSRNYLETWGRTWINDIPFGLRYLFHDSISLNTDRQLKEYVVLSEILPDEVNAYCGGFKHEVIETINDIPVRSMDDLDDALVKDNRGFCTIKFMGNPMPLIIDTKKAIERNKMILEKYQVPAQAYPEVKS